MGLKFFGTEKNVIKNLLAQYIQNLALPTSVKKVYISRDSVAQQKNMCVLDIQN
jgi:hypothetical protein